MAGAVSLMEGWATVKSVPWAVGSVSCAGDGRRKLPSARDLRGTSPDSSLVRENALPPSHEEPRFGEGVNNLALVC